MRSSRDLLNRRAPGRNPDEAGARMQAPDGGQRCCGPRLALNEPAPGCPDGPRRQHDRPGPERRRVFRRIGGRAGAEARTVGPRPVGGRVGRRSARRRAWCGRELRRSLACRPRAGQPAHALSARAAAARRHGLPAPGSPPRREPQGRSVPDWSSRPSACRCPMRPPFKGSKARQRRRIISRSPRARASPPTRQRLSGPAVTTLPPTTQPCLSGLARRFRRRFGPDDGAADVKGCRDVPRAVRDLAQGHAMSFPDPSRRVTSRRPAPGPANRDLRAPGILHRWQLRRSRDGGRGFGIADPGGAHRRPVIGAALRARRPPAPRGRTFQKRSVSVRVERSITGC